MCLKFRNFYFKLTTEVNKSGISRACYIRLARIPGRARVSALMKIWTDSDGCLFGLIQVSGGLDRFAELQGRWKY